MIIPHDDIAIETRGEQLAINALDVFDPVGMSS